MADIKEFVKKHLVNPARMDAHGNILWEQRVESFGGTDLFTPYQFVLRKEKVKFDKEAYEAAKDGQKIINWVIPEMGLSSGGHINIFRFVMMLQNAGFKNRMYIIKPIAFHSSEECREFLRKHYAVGLILVNGYL